MLLMGVLTFILLVPCVVGGLVEYFNRTEVEFTHTHTSSVLEGCACCHPPWLSAVRHKTVT